MSAQIRLIGSIAAGDDGGAYVWAQVGKSETLRRVALTEVQLVDLIASGATALGVLLRMKEQGR